MAYWPATLARTFLRTTLPCRSDNVSCVDTSSLKNGSFTQQARWSAVSTLPVIKRPSGLAATTPK